jgi:hypothetical protein
LFEHWIADLGGDAMKIAAISLVLGFMLHPIAYHIPLRACVAQVGRLVGGGLAMSIVVYAVLRIGWDIVGKISDALAS